MVAFENELDGLLGGVASETRSETKQDGALLLIHLGEVPLELTELGGFLLGVPPQSLVVIADKLARLGRLVALIHNLVKRHVESTRPLLESLDGRNGVAVLDAGDVAAEKAGGFLDVALTKVFSFAESSESLADLHSKASV